MPRGETQVELFKRAYKLLVSIISIWTQQQTLTVARWIQVPATLRLAVPTTQAFTLAAKRREQTDSLTASGTGAMLTNIRVLAFPPRQCCSRYVSLLLRYGTWASLLASATITSPARQGHGGELTGEEVEEALQPECKARLPEPPNVIDLDHN